jgi:hypothetical protein
MRVMHGIDETEYDEFMETLESLNVSVERREGGLPLQNEARQT